MSPSSNTHPPRPTSATLYELPPELVDIIFGYLSAADRLCFRTTCTHFSSKYASPLLYPKKIRRESPERFQLEDPSPQVQVDHDHITPKVETETKSPDKHAGATVSEGANPTTQPHDQRNRDKLRSRLKAIYSRLLVALSKRRPTKVPATAKLCKEAKALAKRERKASKPKPKPTPIVKKSRSTRTRRSVGYSCINRLELELMLL